MKILFAATPAVGHLNPILSTARVLADSGHEIVVTTSRAYADRVEAAGLPFHPLQGQADLDTRDINALFPERRLFAPGFPQLRFDMERIFIDTVPDQFATLQNLLRKFPADLIVADSLFTGTLPFLLGAVRNRPRIAGLGITGLLLSRDDGAPFGPGIPPAENPEELEECRVAGAFASEHLYTGLHGRLNAILDHLGAQPVNDWFDSVITLPDVFLQASVPGFEYPRHNLPESVRFIGCMPAIAAQPLEDALRQQLESAVAQKRKVVLVTQGTVSNDDLGQLLLPTAQALASDPDYFVVATTGGRSVSALGGTFPANAVVREYLPLAQVLPYVSALVTNGGFGTVTQSLAAGIPVVVGGLTEDKPEVAARVAWSGAGLDLHTSTPTLEVILHAVREVITNRTFAAHAVALAEEFARYDTARELELALAGLFQVVG